MSPAAAWSLTPLGGDCFALDRGSSTVAIITSQGYVDWLLWHPEQTGPRFETLYKETHLSYTLGLKFNLFFPHLTEAFAGLEPRLAGDTVELVGHATAGDGRFCSTVTARLHVDGKSGHYRWEVCSHLRCTAAEPVSLDWLEYNNVYPGQTGRCFLYEAQKEYCATLMEDADGVIWAFPHQHLMHYGPQIQQRIFAVGTWAGFFEPGRPAPVVTVLEAGLPPDWRICDMYYDLHCGARPSGPLAPGQELSFVHRVQYLAAGPADRFWEAARPLALAAADYEKHGYPRLALGRNRFAEAVAIDGFDDASGFRPEPPARVWERTTGHQARGALRLHQKEEEELVWSAEPPSQIPPDSELQLRALVRTAGCTGQGVFLRVRYHTFVWHPEPHIEWAETLASTPVNGTVAEWVEVVVPPLVVPAAQRDYLVWIDLVLDGPGTAWVTDVDVDLQDQSDETAGTPGAPEWQRDPAYR